MSKPETGIKSIASGRTDTYSVDPRLLKVKPGWNSRDFNDPENIEHVHTLGRSIAVEGVKEPITIFYDGNEPYINNGECRWRGTMYAIETLKADIKTVPVRLEDRYANDADRILNQLLRNSGKPFSQMELSNHFKRLLGSGLTQTQISDRTGYTNARVSQILNLQTLPEPVKEMVVKQQVASTTAVAMVKEHGGTEAEKQLKEGIAKAQIEGRTKVKPSTDLTNPPKQNNTPVNIRTALKEAFEYADIDNSEEDLVVIKFPASAFEIVRNLLDL